MKLINFFSIFCFVLTLIYVIADIEKYGIKLRVIITALSSLLILFYIREQSKTTMKQRAQAREVGLDQSLKNKRFDFDCSGIKHIQIEYQDYYGNRTSRSLEIYEVFKKDNDWFINAYCYLAQGDRTFKVNRIESMLILKNDKKLVNSKDMIKYLRFFCY